MELDFYNNHYVVHFLGSINPDDIELIYKPQEKYFSDEAKNFIENIWQDCIVKHPQIYDGDLFEFISLEKNNDKLKLFYDYTKYRYTRACRIKEYAQYRKQNCYVSNHIAIPVLIKTTDNKFLINSCCEKVNNIQKWKFPGGFWEKCAPTILDNVKKEVNEEIGNIELKNTKVIAILTCSSATYIVCLSDINMTSAEFNEYIIKNKDKAIDNYELKYIRFIDFSKESITDLINNKTAKFDSFSAFCLYSASWWLDNINNL